MGKAFAIAATAVAAPELILSPRKVFASYNNQNLTTLTVDLSQYPALANVGGSVVVKFPGLIHQYAPNIDLQFRFILSRSTSQEFLAEEGYCPHKQSPLGPFDGSAIRCPLPLSDGHGSTFGMDGSILNQNDPSHRNLVRYPATFDSSSNTVSIDVTGIQLAVGDQAIDASELYQNFPNPVKNTTAIRFRLSDFSKVSLTITNTVGQTIAILTDGELPAGEHSFDFDATIWNSGTYFYHLNVDGQVFTKQMVVAK